MLVLKTLEVEWYVDIKAYIQVWFEILMDSIFSYIACLCYPYTWSCAQTLHTCAREGLVTQVQILGLASEFKSIQ